MPARQDPPPVEQVNESAPSAPRPLLARLARYLVVAIAGFLLLCGLAALAVPLAIQHVVLERIGESIGRQVTIERTRFNPFKLTVTARGVRIAEQDPSADFLTIDRVLADLSIASIRHLAPVIEALKIEAPIVRLQRLEAARFNFSDIVERLAAAPAEPRPEGEPARFALHNLELSGAEIIIDDKVLGQVHRVTDLQAGIPFVSNLDNATSTTVEPALSALVNGSRFRIGGRSTPFSETRETSLDVELRDLEIATYLPLSPVPLGFTVPKGRLGADLKVHFAQEAGAAKLGITGTSWIDDLRIDARDGPRLVLAKRIALGIAGVQPLENRYAFGNLDVDGLAIDVTRGRDGRMALVQAFSGAQEKRPRRPEAVRSTQPQRKDPAPAGSTAGNAVTPANAIVWTIRKTMLRNGRVGYRDETVEPAVVLDHRAISIDLAEIGNRQAVPAAARLALKQDGASTLTWQGELDLARSRAGGRLDAKVASVAPYLPYIGSALAARLETGAIGVNGDLEIGWTGDFSLEVGNAQASLEKAVLTLAGEGKPSLAVGRLSIDGVKLSLAERMLHASGATLSEADIQVERDAQGDFNLQRLLAQAPAGEASGRGESGAGNGTGAASPDGNAREGSGTRADRPASDGPAPSWKVKIDKLELARNQVAWRDLGAANPVSLPITELTGSLGPVGTDMDAKSNLDLQARLGKTGTLKASGGFSLRPLSLQLAIQLQRLALAPFDPYLARQLALSIDEGSMDTAGKLRYEAGRVAYSGRLEVAGLRSRERDSDRETIRWKRLLLDGIDVDVDPAQLGPKDRIAIGGITLSDFFARVLLSEDGRFNLQDIIRADASAQPGPQAPAVAKDGSEGEAKADPGAARRGPAPGDKAAGPVVRLGAIKLEQGRSNFTDRFVRPNYSVNLTDLNGGLSAMASDRREPSELALTGRVDGNAPIDISGKVDPLGPALYADVRAKANGIDLPTLTPYSAKYIGYTIEKGKLNLDVHYKIEDDRLEATNRVVLDQLTLGEKVESPDATNLPIQFALGLLKNSKGEIDVSLPIAGSLDDPQFSIGGLIGNAIANLLTRVVTAPFSALASAFGGGKEELSYVEFQPGSARLAQESIKRLQLMAKALAERPALKLEIAGRVDPKAEQDAIRRERLDARLRALKRREAGAAAGAQRESQERQEEAAAVAGVTVSSDEYPALLQKLYDETELPDKPRNSLGAASRLEVPELEQLLMASIDVDADSARRLGTRRAQAVQRWLASQGKVSEDRVFLLAPRINPSQPGPNQSKPQCTAACAEFSLR
jgi:uncharacterized protein involved in outer membrane biogenesis